MKKITIEIDMDSIKEKCIEQLNVIMHQESDKDKEGAITFFNDLFWESEPSDEQPESFEHWIMKGMVEDCIDWMKDFKEEQK